MTTPLADWGAVARSSSVRRRDNRKQQTGCKNACKIHLSGIDSVQQCFRGFVARRPWWKVSEGCCRGGRPRSSGPGNARPGQQAAGMEGASAFPTGDPILANLRCGVDHAPLNEVGASSIQILVLGGAWVSDARVVAAGDSRLRGAAMPVRPWDILPGARGYNESRNFRNHGHPAGWVRHLIVLLGA